MAKREGFQVFSTVVTPSDSDTWAVAEANDIKGGLHSVKTKEDLANIPEERQDVGMVVYVQDEDKYYEKRGNEFVERKEVQDNQNPWTTTKTIRTDNYGATMTVPYVFLSNPKLSEDENAEPYEYSATNISSSDVVVDSKMHAYSMQEFKSTVLEVNDKGFKLISKLVYDSIMAAEFAPGIEPFDVIEDKDVPAIIKPYKLKEGDELRGQNIIRTTPDGSSQIVESIVNVRVKNLKKANEITKNENGTYSAGTTFPLVFVSFNEDNTNVAFGKDIRGAGLNTVAVGTEAAALGIGAISYGYRANAAAEGTIAVGEESVANEQNATAVGMQSQAAKASAVAVGANALAAENKTLAVGVNTSATGMYSIALGAEANAVGNNALAVGNMNGNANGEHSIAIGSGTKAEANASIALGYTAAAKANNSLAIGLSAEAMGKNSIAIGAQSKTYDSEEDVFSVGAQEFGGTPELTRRIVHVAEGKNGTDAVNKKQLDDLAKKIPVVPSDAKYTDTTYDVVVPDKEGIAGKNGLMTAADKAKLDSLEVVDYKKFIEMPKGDSYVLLSTADTRYAPRENEYLKSEDVDKKLEEYTKAADVEEEVKKLLYSDEAKTQPIYAKANEVLTKTDVTEAINEQLTAALTITTGGDNSKTVDKYVTRSELTTIINEAIESYISSRIVTIDDKNRIHIGGLSGDGVEHKDETPAGTGEEGNKETPEENNPENNG